ncbi:hypothetical protein HIM_07211 [Hirsutella minnesotensis 3608]|uniref:Peroxidase n=1 Tax=Hirsutella minnesotensis 3608 TaxID=1043627 RepID=A0A0F7ZZ12_9HYPO|nr:hypothetical protein HIM_07211 [Hirsutella minnesotensis 3608]
MKHSVSLTATLAMMAGLSYGFPRKEEIMRRAALQKRASAELIGDLLTLQDSQLTQTGKDIKAILLGTTRGIDTTSNYTNVPQINSPECRQDTCCIWKHIADDMASSMIGDAGRCNDLARGSIRLGFHDAAKWSKKTTGGGADGSIILAGECESRPDNDALQPTCAQMRTWFDKYKQFNVTVTDMIQMAANVGTVSCPMGPRVRSFVGRKDSSTESPQGLMPLGSDNADKLIALFADKTISADGLVALVGAHSTAQQRAFDPARSGDPLDSTPGVWDTNFYNETLEARTPQRVFKLPSDISLSRDNRTSAAWKRFVGSQGQGPWDGAYSREYVRLSLLGVNNINELTECTKVLPAFIPTFVNPDQTELSSYLANSPQPAQSESAKLLNGSRLNG